MGTAVQGGLHRHLFSLSQMQMLSGRAAFHTPVLRDGRQVPVTGGIKSCTNGKGQQNTDEEGPLIGRKNTLGKVAAASGVGALIGALAAGGKGAASGAGIGAGAATILVRSGAQAPTSG
ncbi:MAG: hypothetical protein KatS3mg004_0340 [Bryobacteraceae bacterium]|nr:MAG: hypothetical protein KatS3mg004_0340 [Bryobacteraceae bacterium]